MTTVPEKRKVEIIPGTQCNQHFADVAAVEQVSYKIGQIRQKPFKALWPETYPRARHRSPTFHALGEEEWLRTGLWSMVGSLILARR
jgi:hypothetical protein